MFFPNSYQWMTACPLLVAAATIPTVPQPLPISVDRHWQQVKKQSALIFFWFDWHPHLSSINHCCSFSKESFSEEIPSRFEIEGHFDASNTLKSLNSNFYNKKSCLFFALLCKLPFNAKMVQTNSWPWPEPVALLIRL